MPKKTHLVSKKTSLISDQKHDFFNGSLTGLLGNFDGDATNDVLFSTFVNVSKLTSNYDDFNALYRLLYEFGNRWKITNTNESIFNYYTTIYDIYHYSETSANCTLNFGNRAMFCLISRIVIILPIHLTALMEQAQV